LLKLGDIGFFQVKAGPICEQLLRFAKIESQCGGVYFNELILHIESTEGETELSAASDAQMEVMTSVLEKEGQC
jgi:hypothetical protein